MPSARVVSKTVGWMYIQSGQVKWSVFMGRIWHASIYMMSYTDEVVSMSTLAHGTRSLDAFVSDLEKPATCLFRVFVVRRRSRI